MITRDYLERDFLELVHRLPETPDERDGVAPYVIEDPDDIFELSLPCLSLPFPCCSAGAFEGWEEIEAWFVSMPAVGSKRKKKKKSKREVAHSQEISTIELPQFLKALAELVREHPGTGFATTAWGPSTLLVSAFQRKKDPSEEEIEKEW